MNQPQTHFKFHTLKIYQKQNHTKYTTLNQHIMLIFEISHILHTTLNQLTNKEKRKCIKKIYYQSRLTEDDGEDEGAEV